MDKLLKQTIDELGVTFNQRMASHDEQVTQLTNRIGDLEVRANRPPLGELYNCSTDFEEFRSFLKSGEIPTYSKTLNTGTGSEGGYAVPEEVDRVIDSVLLESSPIRRVANVVRSYTQDYKRLINLRGTAGGWVGETDARPDTATPSLAEITFPTGELYACPVSTQWLLDDASFDAEGWLRDEIADVFAQMEGAAFVSGSGTKQPKGFLSVTMSTDDDGVRAFGSLEYMETNGSGVIAPDDLLDTLHLLKPAYRANGTWAMNDTTLAAIRKLKDTTNQYFWVPGLRSSESDMLLGHRVLVCPDMLDVAAGAYSVAFGDFRRGYTIVDRNSHMLRDPYTDKPNVKFYATKRVSGMVTNSEAIKVLKIKA